MFGFFAALELLLCFPFRLLLAKLLFSRLELLRLLLLS